jgi:hypothetical protein
MLLPVFSLLYRSTQSCMRDPLIHGLTSNAGEVAMVRLANGEVHTYEQHSCFRVQYNYAVHHFMLARRLL